MTEQPANAMRFEARYGLVFLLLLATFFLLASGVTAEWARPLTVALSGATLVATLHAAAVPRRVRRAASVVVIFSFLASLVTLPIEGDPETSTPAVMSLLLVAGAPVAIGWSIFRRRVIDMRTVMGALCIYVFFGMFFAFVYTTASSIQTDPFFAQEVSATSAEFLYFSFVTLTTTGYGDLTAAGNLGRALAVLEALIGQIYLVTIVALLVSNLGRGGVRQAETEVETQAVEGDD